MIIFVDIDDTICWNISVGEGNIPPDYSNARPYPERIKKINGLFENGHEIVYWTARGTRTGINWFKLTEEQLNDWGCKYTELRMGKPAYDLFIDDKNISSEDYF
jgi:hypothetical protein